MYHIGPFGPGGWLLSLVVFAAFILLITWGVAWILRRDAHRYGPPPTTPMPPITPPPIDPALQILRERFARGEIGEAEFLSSSRALGAPLPPGPPVGPPS